MKKNVLSRMMSVILAIILIFPTMVHTKAIDGTVEGYLFYRYGASAGSCPLIHYANNPNMRKKSHFLSVYEVNGKEVFCIDPFVPTVGEASDYLPKSSLNEVGGLYERSFKTLAHDAKEYNLDIATLSVDEVEELLKFVLAYGFHLSECSNTDVSTWGVLVYDTNWKPIYYDGHPTFQTTKDAFKDSIFKCAATQCLVHEVVTGEREKDFSHHGLFSLASGTDYDGKKVCDGYLTNVSNSFAEAIQEHYRKIVTDVQNAIANKNAQPKTTIKDTIIETPYLPSTEKNTKLELGTIELHLDADGYVRGTLTNDVISQLVEESGNEAQKTISSYLPYGNVTLNGNTINIEMRYEDAIKCQNNTYSGVITKTSDKTINVETYSYRDCSYKWVDNFTIYAKNSGEKRQALVAGGTPYEVKKTVQDKTITPHKYTYQYQYNFKIKVPVLHTHKWLPHVTEPTCTTEGLTCYFCTCGMMYTYSNNVSDSITGEALPNGGVTEALGHDYENGTWVISVAPTCTTAGQEKLLCGRCGDVIDSRYTKALCHDKAPEDGGNGVWVITKQPKEGINGTKSLYCTKCGKVIDTAPIAYHEHTPGDTVVIVSPTCFRNGVEGKFCTECNACVSTENIPSGHSKDVIWYTSKQASCTQNGQQIGVCADCGTILLTKELMPVGHTESVDMVSIAPSCTEQGEQVSYCSRCGEITDSKPLDSLGHDEGVWTVSLDPTCELAGEQVKTCTRCGEIIESKPISALQHDEKGVWKIDIPATANHEGAMSEYCTQCGMVLQTKNFSVHEHEFGYSCTLLQATCIRNGEMGSVCSKCNAVYKVTTIPATGHDYQENSYISSIGTHARVCTRCRHILTENHAYEIVSSVTASCNTAGYQSYRCVDCGYRYTDSFVAPTGHYFSRWTPDADEKTHTRYCSNPDCGVFEQQLHTWSEYEITEDATMKKGMIRTRTCTVCGETESYEGEDNIQIVMRKSFIATMTIGTIIVTLLELTSMILKAIKPLMELKQGIF